MGGIKARPVLYGAVRGSFGVVGDVAVAIAEGVGEIFEAVLEGGLKELGAGGADGVGESCVELFAEARDFVGEAAELEPDGGVVWIGHGVCVGHPLGGLDLEFLEVESEIRPGVAEVIAFRRGEAEERNGLGCWRPVRVGG